MAFTSALFLFIFRCYKFHLIWYLAQFKFNIRAIVSKNFENGGTKKRRISTFPFVRSLSRAWFYFWRSDFELRASCISIFKLYPAFIHSILIAHSPEHHEQEGKNRTSLCDEQVAPILFKWWQGFENLELYGDSSHFVSAQHVSQRSIYRCNNGVVVSLYWIKAARYSVVSYWLGYVSERFDKISQNQFV